MRIQLDIPNPGAEQAKSLMRTAGFKTWTEFFNNAAALLQWAVRHTEAGDVIVAFDESRKTMKELVMPFLQQLSHASAPKRADRDRIDEAVDYEKLLAIKQREIESLTLQLDHFRKSEERTSVVGQ